MDIKHHPTFYCHSPFSPSSPINRRGAGVSLDPQSTAAAVVPDPRSEPHPMQRFLGRDLASVGQARASRWWTYKSKWTSNKAKDYGKLNIS